MQAANFIHNEENKILKGKLVAWQASDEDIRFSIVKDRENNDRFFCTVRGLSGKITNKTQRQRHLGMPKHMSYKN